VVTAVVIGAFYFVTKGLGYSFDDFPQFIPEIN
jgi:predicted secreted protein